MLAGNADIAEAAEFPFAAAVLKNNSISIIAVNDEFVNDYIVALKNHGIENISDLKGKTIGVTKGTIAEFYLGRFLDLNNIPEKDVNIVNIDPKEYVRTVSAGSVDALVAWQPYINQIQNQVNDIIIWPVQSSQTAYGVLICNSEWITQHPISVKNFLTALNEAQNFILNRPDQAKVIVKNTLNYSDSYIKSVWAEHKFSLSLEQSLVIAMKDEAQWMINNQLTNQTKVPNFTDFIFTDGLKSVIPDAVTIIK